MLRPNGQVARAADVLMGVAASRTSRDAIRDARSRDADGVSFDRRMRGRYSTSHAAANSHETMEARMGNDFTTYAPRALECGEITGDVDVRPAIVGHTAPFTDPVTERTHRIWSAGNYDRISVGFRHEAEAFVERQSLTMSNEVLDLACGSGNLTIPAARTGATVTGFDIVPSLLDATPSGPRAKGCQCISIRERSRSCRTRTRHSTS